MSIHPNCCLLSNSSCILLHKCPRKFQLYKLLKRVDQDISNVDLDFGSWVGIGIQEYLVTGDEDAAAFKMMLSCKGDINDEAGERSKKTFGHALIALSKFVQLRNEELQDFDLVYLANGNPAIELGFILTCINGFTYRGFLDALLVNRITNELVVLECKTTKFKNIHEAVYKNSGQGLGYSLVTDAIASQLSTLARPIKSAWNVLYPIYKCGDASWEIFEFRKNNTQRAVWIQDLLIDIKQVQDYEEASHYPMRGESCYDFGRVCDYFDVCDMSDKVLIGPLEKVEVQKERADKYAFKFDLMELIAAQSAKMVEG